MRFDRTGKGECMLYQEAPKRWDVTRAWAAAFEATRRCAAAVSKSPNEFLSVNCEWHEAVISY
eukprot:COSAG02_NODE_16_length_56207_cov_9.816122_29_plen_63_part_00